MGKSKRGFIVPLLLALVAVMMIGGGAYLYLKSTQNSQLVGTATTTPPAGFSVYTGKLFDFFYPTSWVITQPFGGGVAEQNCNGFDINIVSNPVSRQTLLEADKDYFHYLGSNSSVISVSGGIDELRITVAQIKKALAARDSATREKLLRLTFYSQQMDVVSMESYPSGSVVAKDEYTLPQYDKKGAHVAVILNYKNNNDIAHIYNIRYIAPTKDFSETILQTVIDSINDKISKETCPTL